MSFCKDLGVAADLGEAALLGRLAAGDGANGAGAACAGAACAPITNSAPKTAWVTVLRVTFSQAVHPIS